MKTDAKNDNAPVVGGTLMAVNVDVVAATGYRASKLLGSAIYNDEGEKIGKLDDFIVGSDSEVSIAVVAFGGFLNMGARMVAVPAWNQRPNTPALSLSPSRSGQIRCWPSARVGCRAAI